MPGRVRPVVTGGNAQKYTSERALQKEHHMADKPSKVLIRPGSEYIGDRGLAWTPLDQR